MGKNSNKDSKEIKIDGMTNKKKEIGNKFFKNKKNVIITVVLLVIAAIAAGLILIGKNVESEQSAVTQPTENVVPKRPWADDKGQSNLPKPKIIDGVGKGTITTVDHRQNGSRVSAPMVGIDAVGGQSGATLAPPEDISKVGWYVRSAPFGSKNKGSSVITGHIDYNGVTGYGSIFTSLRKGDPITIINSSGQDFHYVVESNPININKTDAEYTKKTMNSINKMKGENKLVLVTCGGQFLGSSSPLGYADNIVVIAKPVKK